MHILLVAATPFEIQPTREYLEKHFIQQASHQFQKGDVELSILITGVGLPMMAYAMGRVFGSIEAHLAINAGLGGSFRTDLKIGDVVQVASERFADLGVQEADGRFTDVHELGLIAAGQAPFSGGKLINKAAGEFSFLPTANGLSVNKVHGYRDDIESIIRKYPDAEIESMEGAAFFYACLQEGIPFLQIRGISNYVEPRNRDNWNVPLAIERLNQVLTELLKSFF